MKKTGVILLILLAAFRLNAQELKDSSMEGYDLIMEELLNMQVAVASTQGDNILRTPSSVTVIGREDIERFGFSTIAEAIQTVAGISVERTYLKRNLATGRGVLQDHYANKVLVLINGISSWNAVTGEGNLDRVMIEDVERIEILKGPASILYGTNAYSAAVNVVLKRAREHTASVHAGYGINNSYEAGASVSLGKDDLIGYFSIHSIKNSGPERAFTDEQNITKKLNDYTKSNTANLNIGYKSHSFLVNVFQAYESYYGVTPRFSSGAGNPHTAEGLLLNYTFNKQLIPNLNLKAGASYDYGGRDISRTANDSIRAAITGNRANGFLRINYEFLSHFSFEIGADIEKRYSKEYRNYIVYNDSTLSANGMSDLELMEYSGFAQFQAKYKKFSLLFGGRITTNELFGNNFSPRATFVYSFNDRSALKLIYGESYRTPALFENYFYSTTTVFGNKNLKPETARSYELNYVNSFGKFFMQALVYYAQYENKIVRTKDTSIVLSDGKNLTDYPVATVYSNGHTFSAKGIELELKYINPRLVNGFISFDYTLGDKGDAVTTRIIRSYSTTDKDTINKDIYNFLFVPKATVSAGLNREIFKGFSASILCNYIGARGAIKPDLDPELMIDLNLHYKHTLGKLSFSHVLGVKNLTDSKYLIPEYSRLGFVNAVPFGTYRHIGYTMRIAF
jgi:outer membrane receptor protein involved in Fe transport